MLVVNQNGENKYGVEFQHVSNAEIELESGKVVQRELTYATLVLLQGEDRQVVAVDMMIVNPKHPINKFNRRKEALGVLLRNHVKVKEQRGPFWEAFFEAWPLASK